MYRGHCAPCFFAYEDQEQIIELLIETFKHLAVAASIHKEEEAKAITLWESMDAFMTGAVSKNLKIVDKISKHFDSNLKPYHMLCKSHTVDKLNTSDLKVLSEVETNMKQRNTLENIFLRLKLFFRGKKTTVEQGCNRFLFDTGFT